VCESSTKFTTKPHLATHKATLLIVTALTELSAVLQAKRELPPAETRRALRKAAGATLEQVARACNVTPQAVQFWETGSTPRGANLSAYLEVLRVFRKSMSEDGAGLKEVNPKTGAGT
jgi:DNA-binding transcriptional regulator YiaG